MANFDYQIHPVVGRLNISDMSGYGKIKVYGYLEGGTFKRIPTSEVKAIFSPDGTVFASKTIKRDYYGLNNALVFLYVMPNQNEGGSNAYVWNYDYEVEPIGTRIVELKEPLGDNGGYNYEILTTKDLWGKESDVFIHSSNRLFFIKGGDDSRLIPFFEYSDNLPIVGGYPDSYFIGNNFSEIKGYVDVTSDEQLVDWFLRIAKPNLSDIQKESGKIALQSARESLLSMKNLPENIALSRIKRLQSMVGSFVISRDNLNTLAQSPWFKPTIDSAVGRYRDDFLENVKKEHQQELEKLQELHKQEIVEEIKRHEDEVLTLRGATEEFENQSKEKIKELNKQISDAQSKLDKLGGEIAKKQDELSSTQERLESVLERKDDIINDFKVVRDVLGLYGRVERLEVSASTEAINIASVDYTDKPLPIYKGFENNLESCLALSQTKVASISELANAHAHHGVLLLPNMDVAMAVVASAGKAWFHIAYVSAAWKSFEDVWTDGLHQVVSHCEEMPDVIHYFVLRNINLSCLSNYLQPLADMEAGVLNTFPNTEIRFPDNLRILLTASDEELIPMSEGVIKYFGCISREVQSEEHGKIDYSEAKYIGYLDTKLLVTASKKTKESGNCYQDYLNE